jgi:hypothetical protein
VYVQDRTEKQLFAEPAAKAYSSVMKTFPINSPSSRIGGPPRILTAAVGLYAALFILLPGLAQAAQGSKDVKKGETAAEAGKPATQKTPKASAVAKSKAEKGLVTGSLIPQQVSKTSGPLHTAFPVYVISSEQIQRSGASSVAGVLGSYGMRR